VAFAPPIRKAARRRLGGAHVSNADRRGLRSRGCWRGRRGSRRGTSAGCWARWRRCAGPTRGTERAVPSTTPASTPAGTGPGAARWSDSGPMLLEASSAMRKALPVRPSTRI
jgi:hypothetical protein